MKRKRLSGEQTEIKRAVIAALDYAIPKVHLVLSEGKWEGNPLTEQEKIGLGLSLKRARQGRESLIGGVLTFNHVVIPYVPDNMAKRMMENRRITTVGDILGSKVWEMDEMLKEMRDLRRPLPFMVKFLHESRLHPHESRLPPHDRPHAATLPGLGS